jgi:processive 1,2-diacylglycerol beta-glucosyltransferase/1,2-diacylglycerol 3-beta-galactosyltransferase
LVKYLFFYLKTGGGHLAPAKAVAEKIRSKHNNKVEILLADGLSDSNRVVKKIIEDGYRNSVNKALFVFELLYALNKIKVISFITAKIVTYFIKPGIERLILEHSPKKIVIFHFFIIQAVFEVIARHNLEIKVITVVTDPFTAHPFWFIRRGQRYIVFSESLRENCIKNGIPDSEIKVFPFVLDRRFSRRLNITKASKIKQRLGFKEDSKIILIMGGGDGMPRGKKILKKIITGNIDAEIAVVCGNNTGLYNFVMMVRDKYKVDNLKVFRYIDFVHSLISISDIVITKCGASTFMEILLMGKIPVINNYIWEQEKGNMEFIRAKRMGLIEKDIKKLPQAVNMLLNDGELYNSIVQNINNASLVNGVNDVSNYILKY